MLRQAMAVLATAALFPAVALGANATLYKSPTCGCCGLYVEYLEANGYSVDVRHPVDLGAVKARHGVAPELASCHTTLIDGYAFEGHVPLDAVERVLEQRPPVSGVSVPGMPTGVPGMGGPFQPPLQVFTLDGEVFATYFRLP